MSWNFIKRELKYKGIVLYAITVFLFSADRIIKNFFIKNPSTKRIFLFFNFSLTKNKGIAFGLYFNKIALNLLVMFFIALLIILFLSFPRRFPNLAGMGIESRYGRFLLFLILLAAISNFIDRALYGAVIDYIELPYFVSFNIADIMITIGFLIVIWIYFFEKKSMKLLVISAPTGCGKNTIANMLLEQDKGFEETVSCATRKPREKEKDGREYYFISEKEFEEKIKNNEFIEWAKVHGLFYYGTLKKELERITGKGKIPLLVIDVEGGMNIKKLFSDALLVFIKPDSLANLEKRIRKRAAISDDEVRARLETAKKELEASKFYDRIIINPEGHPERAVEELRSIIEKLGN